MTRNTYLLLFLINIPTSFLAAQIDTLGVKFSYFHTSASEQFQPHYLHSNRWGLVNFNQQSQNILKGHLMANYSLGQKFDTKFELELASIDLNNNFLQQGYAEISFDQKLAFFFGYKAYTLGMPPPSLSSGSLALSNNARPIPKIGIGIPEFTEVPFTFGYLEIKGMLSHGWFEKDRAIESPYLHEKSFFFRAGGKLPFRFKGGLMHFAHWGGITNGIELPDSFDDYLKVFFVQPGSIEDENLPGEAANVLGNHLGTIEFGAELDLLGFKVDAYHQTPYEDNTGTKRFWRKNRDRLFGIKIHQKKIKLINNFLYEYIYTIQQTHPGLNIPVGNLPNYGYGYGGRDNYYNNYLYLSGWTFKNRILGTPLFLTDHQIRTYSTEFTNPDNFDFKIINNRIKAHHFGIEGEISKTINYKFLSTYTENYGNYGGLNGGMNKWGSRDPNYNFDYYFDPPRKQWYFLLETNWHVPKWENFNFTTSFALDQGEMIDNFGIMLGIEYQPVININSKKQRKKSDEKE